MRQLGKYRLVRPIGSGGMGVVYLARDHSLDRDVAVKILAAVAGEGQSQAELDRFYVEAKAIAALRHPNIIVIYELGHEGTVPFIAMEYLRGRSLAELIRDQSSYSDAEKVRIIGDVCLALQHAHDRGIVHRDVKPANIHVGDDGSIKLLDFGVARFADATRTQSMCIGTPSYLAPEVIAGHGADARSDLFALGVTLSEWLTFVKPFGGDDVARVMWRTVHDEPAPIRQLRPSLSPQLERVVLRALTKDPALRYQRADQMRADLERAVDPGEPTVVGPTRTEPGAAAMPLETPRRNWIVPAIGVVVAMATASAWWLLPKRPASAASMPVASAAVAAAPAAARSQEPASDRPPPPLARGALQTRAMARAAAAPGTPWSGIAAVSPADAAAVPEESSEPALLAPIGTRIVASLLDELDTSRSRAGDAFRAVLDEPIVAGSRELAPAGAQLGGRVYAVGRTDRPFVEIALVSVVVNGRAVPIRTGVYRVVAPPSSGPSLTALIIGAAAGAGLGAAIGGKSGALTGAAAAIAAQTTVPGAAYISGAHMAFKLAEAIEARVLQ